MNKIYFNDLEDYLKLLLIEARKLAKRKRKPKDWCSPKCISCLVAEARFNIDKSKDLGLIKGDTAMLEAKGILLEESYFNNWENK